MQHLLIIASMRTSAGNPDVLRGWNGPGSTDLRVCLARGQSSLQYGWATATELRAHDHLLNAESERTANVHVSRAAVRVYGSGCGNKGRKTQARIFP
jgi:hypothetical protein